MIEPTSPHIIFEIDALGNITSQACNYPTGKVCEGEMATHPFETALAKNKLIKPVTRNDRQYRTGEQPKAALRDRVHKVQQEKQDQKLNQQ